MLFAQFLRPTKQIFTFETKQKYLMAFRHKSKQPSPVVLKERCSENMRQIYRKTPMPKCDFNQVAKQLYRNHTLAWVFSRKFAAYFQNTFS